METKVGPTEAKEAWSETKANKNVTVGSLWEDFSQTTGFHGVNKVTIGKNDRLRCFWWTLALLCMTAYMSYNVTKELINYYKYPTVTNIHVELVEELEFPAVTICNQSPFSKWRVNRADPKLEEYLNKTSLLGSYEHPINWSTEFLGPTFRESKSLGFWRNISMNLDDLFYLCAMEGDTYNPCTKVMKVEYTKLGLCGTINFNASDVKKIRNVGGNRNLQVFANIMHDDYTLGSQSGAGLTVILHEPGIHPDAAAASFQTSPGTTTYAVVKKSTFKYLSLPHKAFAQRFCVDTTAPDFNHFLEFFDIYTYEHCLMECKMKKVYEMCGCSLPQDHGDIFRIITNNRNGPYEEIYGFNDNHIQMKAVESLTPICSIYNQSNCYEKKLGQLEHNKSFIKSCACELPCTFSTYEVKLSTSKYPSRAFADSVARIFRGSTMQYMQENMLELRIYYEKLMIESTEQVPVYTTETLIGNLGGQMGICLGASILTLTELGEFLAIVFMAIFRRVTQGSRMKK